MPVPRRCVLHVGAPKTGTTYLQDVLWGSAKALRRQGFRLPLRSMDDHFYLTLALRGRLDPAIDPPLALDVLHRLRTDLRKSRSEHLLISHELLAPVDQHRIAEFLDMLGDFEVHVVVTARDLARQVPAEWQQHVKTRAGLPYGRFVDHVVRQRVGHFWSVQDVASVAQRWGRQLPPERVHIVTVPPAGSSPEVLLTRFCAAAGLSPDGLSRDRARFNESLGYEQTELLRRINIALGDRLPHPRKGYNSIVKFGFAEVMLAEQHARRRLELPDRNWDWCFDVSKEMVVRIEQWGFQVHGDLDDLIPVFTATVDRRRPSDADVAAAGVEAIASMLDDQHRRARPSRFRRARDLGQGARNRLPIGHDRRTRTRSAFTS
jgi:hypothetical protein